MALVRTAAPDPDVLRAVRNFATRVRPGSGIARREDHMLIAPFGDGSSPIAAGQTIRIPVGWDGVIYEWMVGADQAGQFTVGIQYVSYADYPAFANILGTGSGPTLAGKAANRGQATGWQTTVRDGGWLLVTSGDGATVNQATVCLRVREV